MTWRSSEIISVYIYQMVVSSEDEKKEIDDDPWALVVPPSAGKDWKGKHECVQVWNYKQPHLCNYFRGDFEHYLRPVTYLTFHINFAIPPPMASSLKFRRKISIYIRVRRYWLQMHLYAVRVTLITNLTLLFSGIYKQTCSRF